MRKPKLSFYLRANGELFPHRFRTRRSLRLRETLPVGEEFYYISSTGFEGQKFVVTAKWRGSRKRVQ